MFLLNITLTCEFHKLECFFFFLSKKGLTICNWKNCLQSLIMRRVNKIFLQKNRFPFRFPLFRSICQGRMFILRWNLRGKLWPTVNSIMKYFISCGFFLLICSWANTFQISFELYTKGWDQVYCIFQIALEDLYTYAVNRQSAELLRIYTVKPILFSLIYVRGNTKNMRNHSWQIGTRQW